MRYEVAFCAFPKMLVSSFIIASCGRILAGRNRLNTRAHTHISVFNVNFALFIQISMALLYVMAGWNVQTWKCQASWICINNKIDNMQIVKMPFMLKYWNVIVCYTRANNIHDKAIHDSILWSFFRIYNTSVFFAMCIHIVL